MELAERKEFDSVITAIIQQNVPPEVFEWLQQKALRMREENGNTQLNMSFAAIPRKTGRHLIKIADDQRNIVEGVHKGFSIDDWTIDRLCRLWLLMQVDATNKQAYRLKIESLFKA